MVLVIKGSITVKLFKLITKRGVTFISRRPLTTESAREENCFGHSNAFYRRDIFTYFSFYGNGEETSQ